MMGDFAAHDGRCAAHDAGCAGCAGYDGRCAAHDAGCAGYDGDCVAYDARGARDEGGRNLIGALRRHRGRRPRHPSSVALPRRAEGAS